MTGNNDDRSVRARDSIGSQVITGDNSQVSMRGVGVALPAAGAVDIAAEVAGLRELLAEL